MRKRNSYIVIDLSSYLLIHSPFSLSLCSFCFLKIDLWKIKWINANIQRPRMARLIINLDVTSCGFIIMLQSASDKLTVTLHYMRLQFKSANIHTRERERRANQEMTASLITFARSATINSEYQLRKRSELKRHSGVCRKKCHKEFNIFAEGVTILLIIDDQYHTIYVLDLIWN